MPGHSLFLILFLMMGLPSLAGATEIDYTLFSDTTQNPLSPKTEKSLVFGDKPVRLDLAVNQGLTALSVTDDQIDWINARLFNVTDNFELDAKVKQRLKQQSADLDKETRKNLTQLIEFLTQSQFAQRIFLPLDPDQIRLDLAQNPNISGSWQLFLAKPPTLSVHIVGNVKNPGKYNWQSRNSVREYLSQTENLPLFGDYAVVIQPDGEVQHHSLAKWNREYQEIAPGAIVYIPFKFSNSATYNDDLNQQVISLLRNRQP